ncbi:hypothetical protein [Actinomadura rugatobispora]|uniref:DUF3168 domain-containing protein n=1 Tax=Actinomadura rugatobispora TaxID=1994 RepID=A0ABW0ZQM5_9ACTN|nr:hypothetical protein GCM10010200_036450 [Actinomadura rugatobispora]
MIPVAPARPHTDAVVAALQVADVAVGRGEKPPGAGYQGQDQNSQHIPYAVLFPTPGTPDGNVAEPYEYLDYTVQATCVGATQEGAEALADMVKVALVGQRLAIAGRSSYRGELLVDRPATRDDTVVPPEHYAVLQIRWRTQST